MTSPQAALGVSPESRARVLHIFRYFRPDFTGEGLYLEKLATHLQRDGISGDVIVERTRAPATKTDVPAIGQTYYFGTGCTRPRQFYPAMTAWMVANVRKYDVVHFHAQLDRLFLFQLIARMAGRRVVQSSTLDDGLGALVDSYKRPYRPLLRRLCRLIDRAVGISPRLHCDTLRVLPPDRSLLIPQGVNCPPDVTAEQRRGARARWGFADTDIVLLFVGGLCARKDVRFLIENRIEKASTGRIRLLIVGPDLEPDYAEGLRRSVADLPDPSDILMPGYMADPSSAYAAADAFVFASRDEGFGNVLIEAMAYGLPVVSRRLPGVTDAFIDHDRTGFLFDTAAEYRDIVTSLVNDPAYRTRIGTTARKVVRETFDLTVIAKRYAALYRELIGRR